MLKAALEGQDCAPEVWTMKTERNEDIKVQLFSSARTNNLGAICGALCVMVALPLNARVMQQPTIDVECNTRAIEKVRLLDIEGKGLPSACLSVSAACDDGDDELHSLVVGEETY